jgi:hypothetical protein
MTIALFRTDNMMMMASAEWAAHLCSPKRKFWKAEQEMKSGFRRKHVAIDHGPSWVLTPLQSASFEIRISSVVHPSKFFVWVG